MLYLPYHCETQAEGVNWLGARACRALDCLGDHGARRRLS